jgi:protein-S-isoprenylcysteine O-methyltransferase Ste14
MKKERNNFFSESFGLTLGFILFVVLFSILSKELGVEKFNRVLFFIPYFIQMIFGGIIIFLFSLIFLSGIYELTKNSRRAGKNLIVTGIYEYVRHPIYSGFSFIIAGLGFVLNSTGIILTGILWLLLSYFQSKKEETYLLKEFGKTYSHYRKSSSFFVPDFFKLAKDIFSK